MLTGEYPPNGYVLYEHLLLCMQPMGAGVLSTDGQHPRVAIHPWDAQPAQGTHQPSLVPYPTAVLAGTTSTMLGSITTLRVDGYTLPWVPPYEHPSGVHAVLSRAHPCA